MTTFAKTAALLGALLCSSAAFAREFYVRPTVSYIKSSWKGYDDRVAPGVAGGVYFGQDNRHEFSVSLNYTEWEFDDTISGVRYQSSEKYLPVLLDYKFHMHGELELKNTNFYFGPCAGVTKTKAWLRASNGVRAIEDHDTDMVFSYGGTAGFVVKLAPRWDLDVGYRYLRLNQSKYTLFSAAGYTGTSYTNSFTAGVGFRF